MGDSKLLDLMAENIYCETHRCKISVSGCIARQKQAEIGIGKSPYSNFPKVPYDPACENCEQGKKIKTGVTKKQPEILEKKMVQRKKTEDQEKKIKKIPEGYCQCGCGQETGINSKTGRPSQYIRGHNRNKRGTFKSAISDGLLSILDLPDGEKVFNFLESQAKINLRDVTAQAVWILVNTLREQMEKEGYCELD